MGSEKFCIRWNDFEKNISGAFREFKDDEDFFDVTLACDDEQIQAHKVILSACSPFFRNILRRNAHPAPLLYLKGVKYTDLQSVVNFMYHGEVNVAQEKLSSFLAVAEDLKVKGLTQNQTGNHKSKKESFTKSKSPVDKPSPHHPKKENQPSQLKQLLLRPLNINNSNQHMVDDDDIQEVNPIQSEPRDVPEAAQPPSPIYQPLHSLYQTQLQNSNTLAQSDDETLSYPDESYDDYGQYAEDKEYHGDPVLLHPTTAIQSTKGELLLYSYRNFTQVRSETKYFLNLDLQEMTIILLKDL